jgi:hypothetical protein
METNWATEHLQTIRTLMERSALYRRALAPIFTFVGAVGVITSIVGWLELESLAAFGIYWMAVCLVVIAGALILVRRQALKHAEKFWSPPTRRIAQAILPALLIGLVLGIAVVFMAAMVIQDESPNDEIARTSICLCLIVAWTLLYGLALHAASFFTPRGIRLFGWGFVIAGLALLVALMFRGPFISPHLLMGILFGVSHLTCGAYLYVTEQRKNEA